VDSPNNGLNVNGGHHALKRADVSTILPPTDPTTTTTTTTTTAINLHSAKSSHRLKSATANFNSSGLGPSSQRKLRKQISRGESTSPVSMMNDTTSQHHYDEDHAVLVNGLKSLTIKQQERVYSAGKKIKKLFNIVFNFN
jgi:hypothetical protein